MAKKKSKSVVGVEKVGNYERSVMKDIESYTIFGVLLFFVGILFGIVSSGVNMYDDKKDSPTDLDTQKYVTSPEDCVTTDDLDVTTISEVQSDIVEVEEDFEEILPE